MDPSISIDLSSVAGIVALTLTLMHYMKPLIGRVAFLQELPISIYVVAISGGLTWLAHDVLHKLEGDRASLIVQAIVSALAASGAVEWWRAGSKPVADSHSAAAARNDALYLIPILLAVGLSAAGCAGKSKDIAVKVDSTVFTVLQGVQIGADQLAATGAISAETRRALSPYLLKALRLGRSFNEAVSASNPIQAIKPLLDALKELKIQLSALIPASMGGALVADVERAIGLVPTGRQ